jgi:trans-aconitate methyltransferase
MGVAGHLGIELAEYDQKIRTFVPHYETLLTATAQALTLLESSTPTIIDLGVGTGALTEACLAVRPTAQVIGVDADPGILDAARYRLRDRENVKLVPGSFLEVSLPPADAMVACIALHHIPEPTQKQAFYRRAFQALRPGGVLASGDCFPADEPKLAGQHRNAWIHHLEQCYTSTEAKGYLHAWSGEDTYFPLTSELHWLRDAGFTAEVLWRADGFAVVAGIRDR